MQSMLDQVIFCISKPPNERNDQEINILYPWFVKKAQIFSKMKPEQVKEIMKYCSFLEKKRDDIIIKQGDKGELFFIILSGKVSIYVNTEGVTEEPDENEANSDQSNKDDKKEAINMEDEDNENVKSFDKEFFNKKNQRKELDRTKFGIAVGNIGAGAGFGELALINEDCVRNATIIADETTNLLTVHRDLYNRVLKEAHKQEFNQRLDFVNQSDIFSQWLPKYKRQAAFSIRKETFEFNRWIAKQGEPLNGLIFLLKGEAKVVIDSLQHMNQYTDLEPIKTEADFSAKESNDAWSESGNENRHLSLISSRRKDYSQIEQRQSKRHLEVSIVTNGEIIGDLENGLELKTYFTSVICNEPTEVYILDAKNYERLVGNKRNVKSLKMIRKKAESKLLLRFKPNILKFLPKASLLIQNILTKREQEARAKQNQSMISNNLSLTSSTGAATSETQLKSFNEFEFTRGPLIDMYGPGSVFYRNKIKRLQKVKLEMAREMAKQKFKGQSSSRNAYAAIIGNSGSTVSDDGHSGTASEEDSDGSLYGDQNNGRKKMSTSNRGIGIDSNGPITAINDWETSSVHLGKIEDRLELWYANLSNVESKKFKGKEQINRLHRFRQAHDSARKIFPGKKIFLRPRQATNLELLLAKIPSSKAPESGASPIISDHKHLQSAPNKRFGHSDASAKNNLSNPSLQINPISASSPIHQSYSANTNYNQQTPVNSSPITPAFGSTNTDDNEALFITELRDRNAQSRFSRLEFLSATRTTPSSKQNPSEDKSTPGIARSESLSKLPSKSPLQTLVPRNRTKTEILNPESGKITNDFNIQQHKYSPQEYKELKQKLRRKEIELSTFRIGLAIY